MMSVRALDAAEVDAVDQLAQAAQIAAVETEGQAAVLRPTGAMSPLMTSTSELLRA